MSAEETRSRLIKCFAAVFPNASHESIQAASPTTIEGWDSLASVTLISVIEEEFAIELDPEDIEQLVSFDKVLNYVRSKEVAQQ
jgi:acyl carrier protein